MAGEGRDEAENPVIHPPAYGNRSGNARIGGSGQRCNDVVAHALRILFFEHYKQTGMCHKGRPSRNQKMERKNLLRSGTGEAGQIPKNGKDLQWACRIEG